MKAADLIPYLLKADKDPGMLDKLYVSHEGYSAGPAAKLVLGAEMFLGDVDRGLLRERVLEVLVDYGGRFPKADTYLRRDTSRPRRFRGDLRTVIETDMAKSPVATGYSCILSGMVDIGVPDDRAEPYHCTVLVSRKEEPECSLVAASIPVGDSDGVPQFDALRSAFLGWCMRLMPLHGSAGFSFAFSSGMSQNSALCLPLIKRLPGLDMPDAVGFSLEAGGVHHRLKCVNWLTALGDPMLKELGGLESVRQSIGPDCSLHAYPGGAVIQAGPSPRLGDTLAGDIPPAYRSVAQATRSVRFDNYDDGFFRMPKGLDRKQETLAWIRRFD